MISDSGRTTTPNQWALSIQLKKPAAELKSLPASDGVQRADQFLGVVRI